MVYDNLWDGNNEDRQHRAMGRTLQSVCSSGDKECPCRDGLPHFVKPAFVGSDAALEAVEAWYRAAQRDPWPFLWASQVRHVERLVTADAFFVGLNPADVLRKLTLELDMEGLLLSPDGDFAADPSIARHYLGLLSKIKNKRGFDLNVILSQRRIRLNLWPQAFDLIRPVLNEFENEGACVHVTWNHDEGEAIRDVKSLVKELPVGWKKDVISFLDDVSRSVYRHDAILILSLQQDNIRDSRRHYEDEDRSDYDPEDYPESEYDDGFDDSDMEDWMDEDEQDFAIHELLMGGGCSCPHCSGMFDDDMDEMGDDDPYDDLYI